MFAHCFKIIIRTCGRATSFTPPACGHELLTKIYAKAYILLSTLDPGSRYFSLGRGEIHRSASRQSRKCRRALAKQKTLMLKHQSLLFALAGPRGLGSELLAKIIRYAPILGKYSKP